MNLFNIKSIKAFTLAEVLITLAIIGVVAALTIPTLINKFQDQQFKTAYKKAYATANQAWMKAYSEGLLTECDTWQDSGSNTCNADNFKAFKSEMKVSKDCGTDTASCWNMSGEKSWNNSFPTTDALTFIDNSGVVWTKNQPSPAAEVSIDTNGNKGPNQFGKDRAIFVLLYYSSSVNSSYPDTPRVMFYNDIPGTTESTPLGVLNATEQRYRCPSMDTHPCYYSSWITGSQ